MTTCQEARPIARFFQLGNSILGLGVEMHNSSEVALQDLGLDKVHFEDLANVSDMLKTLRNAAIGCLDETDQRLSNLGIACGSVLDDLLVRVDRIKVVSIKHQDDEEPLVQALQRAWPKADVDALRRRLSELRSELEELDKSSLR